MLLDSFYNVQLISTQKITCDSFMKYVFFLSVNFEIGKTEENLLLVRPPSFRTGGGCWS